MAEDPGHVVDRQATGDQPRGVGVPKVVETQGRSGVLADGGNLLTFGLAQAAVPLPPPALSVQEAGSVPSSCCSIAPSRPARTSGGRHTRLRKLPRSSAPPTSLRKFSPLGPASLSATWTFRASAGSVAQANPA